MQKLEESSEYAPVDVNNEIEKFFGEVEDANDICSVANLSIQNNVVSIKPVDMGVYSAKYNPGF